MRRVIPASPLALSVIVVLATSACDDTTAPPARIPAPSGVTRTVAPATPLVVSPEDMHGWRFVQGADAAACTAADRCALVEGPATPPLGSGSARLAAAPGSGASLVHGGHAGTPLGDITALRYATTGEAGIALELQVEFDPTDAARGDVGTLVHQPPAAAETGGWTSHDALAGLWWSTRQAGGAVDRATDRPCVRAHPCGWAALLEQYPAMALSADTGRGAVRLSARRGAEGPAYADALTIGVRGAATTYDFEARAPRASVSIAVTIGQGVVAVRLPADTVVRAGTALAYAFAAGPGRATPLVIVDDTLLLPPSGEIVMDAPRTMQVLADTVYSYATLTPLERRFADLTRELLSSTDKVAVAQAMNDALVAERRAGTDAATLARAAQVADHVVVDPERDSAAVRQVDEALAGRSFHYEYGGGEPYAWSTVGWPAVKAPTASQATRIGPPDAGSTTGRHRARASASLAPAPRSDDIATVADPESPTDQTRIVYTNGISTTRMVAFETATRLMHLAYERRRFGNWNTTVTMHYNPTRSVQMEAYDLQHPCVRTLVAGASFSLLPMRIARYALCKGVSYANAVTSSDMIEAATARFQFELRLPPTNDAVNGLAQIAAGWRAQQNHVLMVGHSQGTIIQAAAVQLLPAIENHALQVANRCVAVLALAPATERVAYGMDEHHLAGLLAHGDIIRLTLPTGWEDIDTPLSRELRDSAAQGRRNQVLLGLDYGLRIHQISSYLSAEVAPAAIDRLVTLHRECVPATAELTLTPTVVELGAVTTAAVEVRNQHNRPLVGRQVTLGGYGYFFDHLGGLRFRAMAPRDGPIRFGAIVAPGLEVMTPVTVPLVRPDFAIRETLLWEWVVVGAGSAPGGSTPTQVPTTAWDGAEGSCYQRVRYGDAYNWKVWELRCNRVYTPVFTRPDSLFTGRRVTGATIWFTDLAGTTALAPPTYYYCAGARPCVASGYLEITGPLGVLGRSAVVTPAVGAASPAGLAEAPPLVTSPRVRRPPSIPHRQ